MSFGALYSRAAVLLVVSAGLLFGCGATSGAPGQSVGDCPNGTTRCSTCGGSEGFCSGSCPAIACPVGDGGGLADASEDASGACPATTPTECHDCGGGAFCVSGSCPAIACEAADGSGVPDSAAADGGGCGACATNQVCVHPSCGVGNAPSCSPLDDGGGCAPGWTYTGSCQSISSATAGPGCEPPPCVPPPPFCADVPAACSGTLRCSCLPNDVCLVTLPGNGETGGQCFAVSGRDVMCGSA